LDVEAQFAFVVSDNIVVKVSFDYTRVAEAVYTPIPVKIDESKIVLRHL